MIIVRPSTSSTLALPTFPYHIFCKKKKINKQNKNKNIIIYATASENVTGHVRPTKIQIQISLHIRTVHHENIPI